MVSGIPNLFTALFLGFCLAFSVIVLAVGYGSGSDVRAPLLTACVMVGALLLFRTAAPTVYTDGEFLYITRWWKKAAISLDKVVGLTEVPQLWPVRPYSATIHFRGATPFGRSLYLGALGVVPSFIFPWVVADLRKAIDARARVAQSANQALQKL
jgi:hypothetical protein